jgi:DNA-binding transcriptional LysR family regulator
MIARPLGVMEEVTCASPAYLAAHGVPRSPDDLAGHRMVGFVSSRTGATMSLEFTTGGQVINLALPAQLLVNGADLMRRRRAWGWA